MLRILCKGKKNLLSGSIYFYALGLLINLEATYKSNLALLKKILCLLSPILFLKESFFMRLQVFPQFSEMCHVKLQCGIVLFPLHSEYHISWDWIFHGWDDFLLLWLFIKFYGLVDESFGIFLNVLDILLVLLLVQLLILNWRLLLFMLLLLTLLVVVVLLKSLYVGQVVALDLHFVRGLVWHCWVYKLGIYTERELILII